MKISTQVLLLCIGLIVRSYYSISKKTASIVDRDFFFSFSCVLEESSLAKCHSGFGV